MFDDEIMEMYLEGKEIPTAKIRAAIRKATVAVEMIPVVCGTSYRNKGVQKLLDAIVDYMPAPTDIPAIEGINPKTDEEDKREPSDDEPFSALAFKIMTDPYVGRLSFFRVYSGTLNTGSSVLNSTKNVRERMGRILQMHANHREDIETVYSGDIAAAVGLKNTTTGDTLCDEKHPIILESSDHLGGSAVLASKAPCKGMVAELIETMKAEMKEYHIEVRLNTPATVETLRTLDPYGVVVACGGEQIVPNVPGADRSNVYYIEDVLMGRVSFEGKNIAVIGGGHVGLEVAHFLCDKNKVTVVEMQKEVGVTIYRTARYKLLSLLQESGVEILTEHAIAGVTDGAVELKKTDTGEIVTRPADIVVMALGNRPDKSYEQQLKDAFDKVVFVGDAHKGGTMADATLSAYENCWFF